MLKFIFCIIITLVIFSNGVSAGKIEHYSSFDWGSCEKVLAETNAERMIKNAITHANAICTPDGVKIGGKKTDFVAISEGTGGLVGCRVTGTIECNEKIAAPTTPSTTFASIQNCEIAPLSSLGYGGSGNKHEFCLGSNWLGGEVGFHCWRIKNVPTTAENAARECSRLWNYYVSGGKECAHLTHEDAVKLKVCGGK